MAGQAGYHLLAQAHVTHAPWPVTTAVSCLPVLVLGMGATLAHLLRDDMQTATTSQATPPRATQASHLGHARQHRAAGAVGAKHLAQAHAAAQELTTAGQPVSRRTLRAAGIRGSNALLGALARYVTELQATGRPAQR